MKRMILVGCLAAQAACTTPDVSKEIEAGSVLAAETGKALRTRLAPLAKSERAAAEDEVIQLGEPVVSLNGTCDINAARAAGMARTDCALEELIDPGEGPVNATATLQATVELEAYFAALKVLTETSASGEIASNAEALLTALGQTGSLRSKTLQRIAAGATENADVVVKVVGFAAERYRVRQLRRVVREADPVIGNLTEIAAAYLDTNVDPSVARAQERLTNADAEMNLALASGDTARHRRAVANLRTALAEYQKAEANATAASLLTLRQLHRDLLVRLTSGVTSEEIQATLNDVFEIAELIKKKGD